VDGLLDSRAGVHFVEVMSCPGGCIGGGGQPYDTDAEVVRERLERLYEVDRRSRSRRSHENADVQALYEDVLGTPLSVAAHRLLHRDYTDRSPAGAAAAV
jgi:iron only hydrogenase large subunit-like protein